MRIAFALISLLLLITCTSKRDIVSRLQGHWHTVGNDHYNSTLDISDSVVVFNKYTLVSYSEEFSLFDSVGRNPVLPFYCGCGSAILPVFSKFKLKEDYLIYDDEELADCYPCHLLKVIQTNVFNATLFQDILGRSSRMNFYQDLAILLVMIPLFGIIRYAILE